MAEEISLKYVDERDRCYGLAGMAMSAIVLDQAHMLLSINLDADADSMIQFAPQYYFAGNPSTSARIAWNQMVQHYTLTMSLLIANVLSRGYMTGNTDITSPRLLRKLRALIGIEGHDTCHLDDDEIDTLFNKQYSYMQRLFSHTGVQTVVNDFVRRLTATRTMTAAEIIDAFSALNYL